MQEFEMRKKFALYLALNRRGERNGKYGAIGIRACAQLPWKHRKFFHFDKAIDL